MSADNGYVLRKKENGKFVLHHYFASADEYPPIDSEPIIEDHNVGWVIDKFSELEQENKSEYGLKTAL